MAVDAADSAAGMRARLPIGLHSPLMTLEAAFVLRLDGFSGALAVGDHPADPFSSSFSDVLAARTVTGLARPLLHIVARIEYEDFPHDGLGELLKLRGVTGFADCITCIGGLLRRSLCGPNRVGKEEKREPD